MSARTVTLRQHQSSCIRSPESVAAFVHIPTNETCAVVLTCANGADRSTVRVKDIGEFIVKRKRRKVIEIQGGVLVGGFCEIRVSEGCAMIQLLHTDIEAGVKKQAVESKEVGSPGTELEFAL